MARYKKKGNPVSQETVDEAMKIAKGTQKPGQTKEHTKLIAQGIQKGIDQYKKQHKTKMRELDKKLKQVQLTREKLACANDDVGEDKPKKAKVPQARQALPWVLLALSWGGFLVVGWFKFL